MSSRPEAARRRPASPATARPRRVSQRAGSGSRAVGEQRLAGLGQHVRGVVAGRAVDARGRPARRPRAARARGAMPEPRRKFEERAVGDAGAASRRRARISSGERCTQWASQTSLAEPAEPPQELDRPAAVDLAGSRPPRPASRPGGCAAARRVSRASSAVRRISSSLTENGAQGARRDRGSWRAAAGRGTRGSAAASRRGSSPRPGTRRRAAGRRWLRPRLIEPRVGWKRMPSSRAASISASIRRSWPRGEQVEVVGGGRAAGEQQLAEADRAAAVDRLLVESRARPRRARSASGTAAPPARAARCASAPGAGGGAC